jgi:WD40 repeat protein
MPPDGRQLAAGSDAPEALVKIWDTATDQVLHTLCGHEAAAFKLAYRPPDGRHLAAAGNGDGTARLWDTKGGELMHTLREPTDKVWGVPYSPDGQHLATASHDQPVKIWDATTSRSWSQA